MAATIHPSCLPPLLELLQNGQAELIKQGAEAKVYKAQLYLPSLSASTPAPGPLPPPILLKHRFSKAYRHPTLDLQLTKQRLAQESRCLVRAARAGVCVPGLRVVDAERGVVGVEWVEGWAIREVLGGGVEGDEEPEDGGVDGEDELGANLEALGLSRESLLSLIGAQLARLHQVDIIHGDLTTSNMMLRAARNSPHSTLSREALLALPPSETVKWELVIIDFGLSQVSTLVEDKAVDLFVLERAFASTHPDPLSTKAVRTGKGERGMYGVVERAYAEGLGNKEWERVKRRLEDVRLRGRKRSMVG